MNAAVRVLIVAPAPLTDDWAGGISNFVRSFVAHMPDDFAVSIAGIAGPGEPGGRDWRDMTIAGREVRFMSVAHIGEGSRGRVPVKARAMWGLLEARRHVSTRGSVIQVHAPAMDLALTRRDAPIVRVVHNAPDNLSSHDAGTFWRHSARALRQVEAAGFRRAARVFFVDRATYEHYAVEGSPGERMSYLHNGIDTAEFAPRDAAERHAARQVLASEFAIATDGPWLLFCGRLDRQKDPALLLATFEEARRLPGLNDAQLLIVGTGPLEDFARQAARDAGLGDAAHFVGTLDHDRLPGMMAASDVLLLTSVYEAAPFVVLEALACGVPVVSTGVGDVPQLVQHERTGWIAAERTAHELAHGVAWAVAEPRDEIGPRAAASMAAYRIQDVLAPFYEAHRTLSESAQS